MDNVEKKNEHLVDNGNTNEDNAASIEMPDRRELFKKATMTAVGLAVGGGAGLIVGGAAATAATAQSSIDCTLTPSELQFANTVDRIFNDADFVTQLQTAPDLALASAGYTLTQDQLTALQTADYNIAPTADAYLALPLVRPVVRIITKGTKPVVRVITKGTQPVVQVVVNTVVRVSPPDPDPTPSPTPLPSPAPSASPIGKVGGTTAS